MILLNAFQCILYFSDIVVFLIQDWAANNETRQQIENTVLYGYYSKY